MYRNGLLLPRSNNDTFNIEQIEILKGPAAILYGRVEPGGLINTVTKKPLDTPYYPTTTAVWIVQSFSDNGRCDMTRYCR
ncbi:MAG: TonB-dependent receptor plug domain-containing protein [Methylococcales bacterium]